MAKRPGGTPEEELWAVVDRFASDPEAFLALEDAETWSDVFAERVMDYWGHEPTFAQEAFFGEAPGAIQAALDAGSRRMERGAGFGGVEFARFRNMSTGQFVSFDNVREYLSGYFFGV